MCVIFIFLIRYINGAINNPQRRKIMSAMPVWNLITSRFIELRFFRGGKEIYLNTSGEIPSYSILQGKLLPITRDEALEAITDHMGWIQFRFRLASVVDEWSSVIRLGELEQILTQHRRVITPQELASPAPPHNYFGSKAA